ncbi:MAG: type IV pilin protein [Desulfococcaceae bacterium]
MMLKNNKAYTLIELMLIVAIIGIIAAIAIPQYMNYTCKTKQSEAKEGLGTLAKLEGSYFSVTDTYSADLDAIGFAMKGRVRYNYSVTSADKTGFTAKAEGKPDVFLKPDEWTINQEIVLLNTVNGCN